MAVIERNPLAREPVAASTWQSSAEGAHGAFIAPAKRARAELSVRSVLSEYPKTCAGSHFSHCSGAKLPTARSVANKVLCQVLPGVAAKEEFLRTTQTRKKRPRMDMANAGQPDLARSDLVDEIRSIARDERSCTWTACCSAEQVLGTIRSVPRH